MHKILSYIRQNRAKVISITFAIIFGYSLLMSANNAYKENGSKSVENSKEEVVTIEASANVTVTDKDSQKLIKNFLKKCTEKEYVEAYEFLSSDCKNELYSTLEDFEQDYCESKQIAGKGYSIEKASNISKYTYKIEFNNMLSSGKSNSDLTYDYYTIAVDDDELKLNINSYLTSKEIMNEEENENFNVTVEKINIFKDYQEVVVVYENKSSNDIKFGKEVYLLNSSGKQISGNGFSAITLKQDEQKTVKYKFNVDFEEELESINFSNVEINYNTEDEYTDTVSVEI